MYCPAMRVKISQNNSQLNVLWSISPQLVKSSHPWMTIVYLPVSNQISLAGDPLLISDYETYRKICAAKKPKSGVPMDLPKLIVQEFSPELAKPVNRIINNIMKTGIWPAP